MPIISPLTVRSNRLELLANSQVIGRATGIIAKTSDTNFFLISNWHVFSGRYPHNQQPLHESGAVPDQVRIFHYKEDLRSTEQSVLDLNDEEGKAKWQSHPDGHEVDVAALRIVDEPQLSLRFFDMSLAKTDLVPQVSQSVSIIGFPYGVTTHNESFPVWKTGNIASEPELPFNKKPVILIDATTREGMSGSPVVIATNGPYLNHAGNMNIQAGMTTLFLGIYSGRLQFQTGQDSHLSSELGLVWKPSVIEEVLVQ